MRPRLPATFLAILIFAGAGCSERSGQKAEPLSFRVDPNRLGERFEREGVGFTLRAPAGWQALPDSLVRTAMDRLRAEGSAVGTLEPEMLALYQSRPDGATLSVSRYTQALPAAARDSLALLHLQAMKRRHPGAQVDDGRFVYHGFEIVQFRAVDSTRVAFKLLLHHDARPLVQLDYVVPRSSYSRELESVESSIGSLEPRS